MRTANFALICFALALQGCTNYTSPLSGPTANLRFLTLPGNKTEIHTLDAPRCDSSSDKTIAIVGHAVHNTGRGSLDKVVLHGIVPVGHDLRAIASDQGILLGNRGKGQCHIHRLIMIKERPHPIRGLGGILTGRQPSRMIKLRLEDDPQVGRRFIPFGQALLGCVGQLHHLFTLNLDWHS